MILTAKGNKILGTITEYRCLQNLKKCFHCGGNAVLCLDDSQTSRKWLYILCSDCGAQTRKLVSGGFSGRSEKEAVDALISLWNERV